MPISLSVLLDENVDRQVLGYLRAEGHAAEHVVDVLEPGADDAAEIAPYARAHDLIVVTKDVDFLTMDDQHHAGVFFLANHRTTAYEIATAMFAVADAFDNRDDLGDVIYLDDWIREGE